MTAGSDGAAIASVAEAYSATGSAWQTGPGRVYDTLAQQMVAHVPTRPGDLALDLGAGTGAASRPLRRAGASVIALDVAPGMLEALDGAAGLSVVADARVLPFASATFDIVVAAFSLNHVADPLAALREVRRVLRRGGRFVAAVYAADDDHPVKAAVDTVASDMGWHRPPWFEEIKRTAMPVLATVDRADEALRTAHLPGEVSLVEVPIPGLSASEMVNWRLGMAHLAPFVATLDDARLAALRRRAELMLGATPEPLVRRVVQLRAVR